MEHLEGREYNVIVVIVLSIVPRPDTKVTSNLNIYVYTNMFHLIPLAVT